LYGFVFVCLCVYVCIVWVYSIWKETVREYV